MVKHLNEEKMKKHLIFPNILMSRILLLQFHQLKTYQYRLWAAERVLQSQF